MHKFLGFIVFFLFIGLASSVDIADSVFEKNRPKGRSMLQKDEEVPEEELKACKVDFEFQDYHKLTSECKGPKYSADICCKAFKEFACPFAEVINDETTDCADAMFSFMSLYGEYPPGTFFNLCRKGTNGLACPSQASMDSAASKRSKASKASKAKKAALARQREKATHKVNVKSLLPDVAL